MPQQRKREESKRLSGERGQIKFIDLGFERWQVARLPNEHEQMKNKITSK